MKALSGIESMKVDGFASYYLKREYEKCLSIGRRKGGNEINNVWQHVIFINNKKPPFIHNMNYKIPRV